jgi:hypothetical protein
LICFVGEYQFQILTGPSQGANIQGFPPCVEYTFALEIFPIADSGNCWRYNLVPSSLNTVQYLGHTDFVHFQETFLVPLDPKEGEIFFFFASILLEY